MKYIFGPVMSRRLGRSLGIDLLCEKVCPLNCIYCEAGDTTGLTCERREYVPTEEVWQELDALLKTAPELDYITFSGSGEPTLHTGIGEIIRRIKKFHGQYKVCVLTNGTLLGDKQVRSELAQADLVIPSIDASSDEEFQVINRPETTLTLAKLVADTALFVKEFPGCVHLELFVVPGVNDSKEALDRFVDIVRQIAPERVELNVLDRPGCVQWLTRPDEATMKRFIKALSKVTQVKTVGSFNYLNPETLPIFTAEDLTGRIIALAERRPVTLPDINEICANSTEEINKILSSLVEEKQIIERIGERGTFYQAAKQSL